jgi:hypothetical protein
MPLPDFTDQTFIDRVMAANQRAVSSRPASGQELFHSFPPITVPPLSGHLSPRHTSDRHREHQTYMLHYAYHQKLNPQPGAEGEGGAEEGYMVGDQSGGCVWWSRTTMGTMCRSSDGRGPCSRKKRTSYWVYAATTSPPTTFRKAQHRFVVTAYAPVNTRHLQARDLKSFTVPPSVASA